MRSIYILTSLLIGFFICGVLFGVSILLSNRMEIRGYKAMISFSLPIISIIPAILVILVYNENIFKLQGFGDLGNWIIYILTVTLVVWIISYKESKGMLSTRKIILDGVAGIAMEIPQRMLMQTLILLFLMRWGSAFPEQWSCMINATIWCLGIISQALILRQKFSKYLMLELIASFTFSIGIGYLFIRSGTIWFPMLAHFTERVCAKVIQNTKYKSSSKPIRHK